MTGTVERAHDAVAAYVARVRAHLAGLDEEEVADLTDGLAGDLSDALQDADLAAETADERDLVRRFGTPADYADELAVAAGLVRDDVGAPGGGRWRTVVGRGRRLVARVPAALSRSGVSELAPVWWVLRGWVFYHLVLWALYSSTISPVHRDVLPESGPAWSALLAFVVASVWLGLAVRRSRERKGAVLLSRVQHVVTVAAVLVTAPVMITASVAHDELVTGYHDRDYAWSVVAQYESAGASLATQSVEDGVYVDGMQVSNLFVYDAQGESLQDVQIYDDRGRPVQTVTNPYPTSGEQLGWMLPGVDEEWFLSPASDADGRQRWNVYPLLGAPVDSYDWSWEDDPDSWSLLDGEELRRPPSPFAKAPALVGVESKEASLAASDSPSAAVDPDPTDPTG